MESFAISGVVQAEYGCDPQGRQVIRRLTQDQKTIHNVFDVDGNRIAEYEIDDLTGTSTLLREYVWMDGVPVAVVEGGEVYFVRSDHIGRPVFATDDTGVVVWTASYLPFGGVHTTTGTPLKLRFPGQWFQSESGLHQNWMRDYDPTTGRYIQADPLRLVDGASVYNYVRNNPLRYVDPTGELVWFAPVIACLVNPWCRSAVVAALGVGYGYLTDEDACYSWDEAAQDAVIGALTAWGGGRALGKGVFNVRKGGLFGKGGYFNRGYNRMGWGRNNGGGVFRAARGDRKTGTQHWDFYED